MLLQIMGNGFLSTKSRLSGSGEPLKEKWDSKNVKIGC